MDCFGKHGKPRSRRDTINFELKMSINKEEQKLCYLKYFMDSEYQFTDEDREGFSTICHKNDFYVKEELQENIGKKYIYNHSLLDKQLPQYIVFYNKKERSKNSRKIEKIVNKNNLMSRNSLQFFRDYDQFKNFSQSVYSNDFQLKNIGITIYGNEIIHKTIYKKLVVKYDFFYVLLQDYESIKAKIDFFKNKQLLELLGAQKIIIDREHLKNSTLSAMLGQKDLSVTASTSENSSETKTDIYNYKLTKGFYSKVEDFLEKVDNDKYILLSRQEINEDFELKSLVGARIEKGLNEFSKVINMSRISKKEMKLNTAFSSSLGITASGRKSSNEQDFLKIYSQFYEIEKLYNIDEIPITYEGFKILNNIQNGEKKKYIQNFYLRALKKNNILGMHLSLMENTLEKQPKQSKEKKYKSTMDNITSYFQIEQLIESLRDPNDLFLNEEGFNTLRIVCSDNLDVAKKKFLKRFVALNGIQYDHFLLYVKTKKKIEIDTFIHEKVRNYKHILKYTEEFMGHADYASCDERGFYFFGKQNQMSSAKELEKKIKKYIGRYCEKNYGSTDNDIGSKFDFLKGEKGSILLSFTYDLFKRMVEHILDLHNFQEQCCRTSTTHTGTPICRRPLSSPILIEEKNENNLAIYLM